MSDTGKYLRTNYRQTGGSVSVGAMGSQIIKIRASLQLDSAADNRVQSIPLGFAPSWVIVKALPNTQFRHAYVLGYSVNTTILYVSFQLHSLAGTAEINANMGATYTQVFEVIGLVASR